MFIGNFDLMNHDKRINHSTSSVLTSEVFFKIYIILFLDTMTQQIFFLMIKINIFWGDLSGISAKTATLVLTSPHTSLCSTNKLYMCMNKR